MWNLVVSKPEIHTLRSKTAMNFKFDFSRKEKHSLNADTELKNDQIKRKMEVNFIIYLKIKCF